MINKTINQKAWFMVLPVLALVAFNAIIPLMTVVDYSVQETFGDNLFFWEGIKWFEDIMRSERFHDALGRQLFFTLLIMLIEVPLGVGIALTMPRQGIGYNLSGFDGITSSDSLERSRGYVEHLCFADIGLLGKMLNGVGFDYNFTQNPFWAWATVVAMDVWHWTSLVVLLCYAGLRSIPDAYYQARN